MKSNLITRAGHDKLVAELKQLWHEERPEITKKVNWAASLGDRSENAESDTTNRSYVRLIDEFATWENASKNFVLSTFLKSRLARFILALGSKLKMTQGNKKPYALLGWMKFMIITRSTSPSTRRWHVLYCPNKSMMKLKC